MMPNSKMTTNRFGKWAQARSLYRRITAHLSSGGRVVLATYTRATVFDAKHVEMFRVTRSGCYVLRGKSWDCIDYTPVRFI